MSKVSTWGSRAWLDHNSLRKSSDELFTKSNKARALLNDNVVCQCYDYTNQQIVYLAFTEYPMTLKPINLKLKRSQIIMRLELHSVLPTTAQTTDVLRRGSSLENL